QAASGAIKKAADLVKSNLADQLKTITDQVQRERAANFEALQRLLLRHDLPDSSYDVNVTLEGQSRYQARMIGSAGIKVSWVIELEIPGSHVFAGVLKVERVAP